MVRPPAHSAKGRRTYRDGCHLPDSPGPLPQSRAFMRRFPLSIRVNSREISPWDSESVKEKVPRSILVYTYRKGMESEQGECHIYSPCIIISDSLSWTVFSCIKIMQKRFQLINLLIN